MSKTIKLVRRIFNAQAREAGIPLQAVPGAWRAIKRKFASLPEPEKAKATAQFRAFASAELAAIRQRATLKGGKANSLQGSERDPSGEP